MRDTVASRSQRLAATLHRLRDGADVALIDKHTDAINGAMLAVLSDRRARGFDIGEDEGGFYARPRSNTAGMRRELRDLIGKCRKAVGGKISVKDWAVIWAALPERTKALLWKKPSGLLDPATIAIGFATERYQTLVPKPEVVLPTIEAELAKIATVPGSNIREPNEVEAEAIAAINAAFRQITGSDAGRVVRVKDGKAVGKRILFGREVDGIYGTGLFGAKDSRRFRP